MSLDFNELKIKKMKSRWGSCSSSRIITLNSELLKLKEELIDYVVVHELSHLVHMNHSREFHALVERYLENSKRHRSELKKIRLA
jgi:predicted metal-dependent hydrolase